MSMTRNGIVYDLKQSTYTAHYNNITFYFSSKNHLEKFIKNLSLNRETLSYSLFKRFNLKLNIFEIYDIVLYKKVESRGFLIEYKGEFYTCPKQVILSGVKVINKK